jgi:hypothetical protein
MGPVIRVYKLKGGVAVYRGASRQSYPRKRRSMGHPGNEKFSMRLLACPKVPGLAAPSLPTFYFLEAPWSIAFWIDNLTTLSTFIPPPFFMQTSCS